MTAAPDRVRARLRCRLVADAADRAGAAAIRHAVFVAEQGVFAGSDADDHDAGPDTLHVLGLVDGQPAGTVRLYPLDPGDPTGDWQGDRLAVLPAFRTTGLGAPLVRFAVATAAAHGGRRMIAHVQPPNETFFRRLGWARRGAETYVGRPHLLMDIALVDRR
ncbi:MAG TPA: MSMEG_0567/Sll0786 family nitrogen starvation N-acetyltransferase [Pseudonocardia sp.]|nr:MSMEG_0567/Sll0786 family nitrogen starvation N-acetyltransferase [Pseudonocardia sp.]